jgi:hypothetical protein
MRLRRILVGLTFAVLSLAAIAGAAFVWLNHAPRRTPEGQPGLSRLDDETLPALREEFNARAGETRIVVLLSPT